MQNNPNKTEQMDKLKYFPCFYLMNDKKNANFIVDVQDECLNNICFNNLALKNAEYI